MFKVKLIFGFHMLIHFLGCALDISKASPLRGKRIERAEDHEFPFVVSIGMKIFNGIPGHYHFCTGALISKKHVLTSEHCFEGIKLNDIQVSVGSVDALGGKKYDVDFLMTFENWAERRDADIMFSNNDVAILRLNKKVDDPRVKPAVISFKKYPELYRKDAMVAGWGLSNSGQIPRYMEKAKLHVINYADCMEHTKEIVGKRVIVPDNFLCTLTNSDAWIQSGDSGGPLFIGNRIIGINGATFPQNKPDDDPNVQNMHMQLLYYKDFIEDIIDNY